MDRLRTGAYMIPWPKTFLVPAQCSSTRTRRLPFQFRTFYRPLPRAAWRFLNESQRGDPCLVLPHDFIPVARAWFAFGSRHKFRHSDFYVVEFGHQRNDIHSCPSLFSPTHSSSRRPAPQNRWLPPLCSLAVMSSVMIASPVSANSRRSPG